MIATYQTSNGNSYTFSFERQRDGSIRPYIDRQPCYGMRNASLSATHRGYAAGRFYIDWATPLSTEAEAKKLAVLWSECTDVYISTGKTFIGTMRFACRA